MDRPPTLLYIHGIGNKPIERVLKAQWDLALAGRDLGDRSRMAYWVDRQRYPSPLDIAARGADVVAEDFPGVRESRANEMSAFPVFDLRREVASLCGPGVDRRLLLSLGERLLRARPGGLIDGDAADRALPLPRPLRVWLATQLTRLLLVDAHDFFFAPRRRAEVEHTVRDALDGPGPFIVVAHSLGGVIAYDVLRRMTRRLCDVPLLVTAGCPLPLREVQDLLEGWTGPHPLRVPRPVGRWVNVVDRLDPVGGDGTLANEVRPYARVEDRVGIGLNADAPWHPHSATGYLESEQLRSAVAAAVPDL